MTVKETLLSIPSPFGPPVTLTKNSWEAGPSPDNVLSIVSGLHGDELNGMYINSLLTGFLNRVASGQEADYKLTGRVQIFPVVNILAAQSASRIWPFDDLDYDLAFPGNDKGDVAEKIARGIYTHTLGSTHGVILKSAELHYEDAPHILLADPDRTTKQMAESLGLDCALRLPDFTTFQLSLFGHWRENDIPSLTLTAGKPGTLNRSICDLIFSVLVDLMTETGVLTTGKNKKENKKLKIYPVNAEHRIISSEAGLFVAEVEVGDFLKKGQKLGEMRCVATGETLEEYVAMEDGYLASLRHYPLTFEKESIAILLGDKKPGFWPF